MAYFLSFLVAMFTSIICIPPLLKFASRFNFLDIPDNRKVHNAPIPRLGGVALVLAAVVPMFLWIPLNSQIWYLILGIAVIFATGLLDDLYDLNYKIKLTTQVIAASFVVYGANIIFEPFSITSGLYIEGILLQGLSILFIVGVTNAMNLSDGLDGLAAGMSLLSLSAISLLAIQANAATILLICVALIGGIFGFLRFNTYPAKIFMGDTGSQFLGFMLAVLSLIAVTKTNDQYSALLPLLLIGMPILDTIAVICIRIFKSKSPFSADKNHLHHRVLNAGYPQYYAVIILYLMQLLFVMSAYIFRQNHDGIVFLMFCLISLGCLIVIPLLQRLNSVSGSVIEKSNNVIRKTSIAGLVRRVENSGLFDTVIVLLVAWYFFSVLYVRTPITKDIVYSSLVLIAVPLWNVATRNNEPLSWLERGVAYMVVVLVVYLQFQGQGIVLKLYAELALLSCLAVCVAIKMLRHKSSGFQGNPLDFLILLLAILGPFFVFQENTHLQISLLVLESILLFYCVEILFIALRGKHSAVRAVMIGHLGLVLSLGLFSSL